ncbi:hypothetical protein QBC35DRAFT_550052, partial [Podospora australis]
TTKENIDQHYRGILVESLPKTIADAIRICQELQIPYLWADSLCIIQWDKDEFGREGYRMDSICSGSHLTIYAKGAASCKDGFLGKQKFGYDEWQYLAPKGLVTPSGMEFPIRKGEVVETLKPLDTHAWCFQEEILPKRQLVYGGDEIELPQPVSVLEYGPSLVENGRGVCVYRVKIPVRPPEYCKAPKRRKWESLVQQYWQRLLTVPTDKLMAIAGVARRILRMTATGAISTEDNYYAGVWGKELAQQLLWWSTGNPFSTASKHLRLHNGVPSWSWASIQGPVSYIERPYGWR